MKTAFPRCPVMEIGRLYTELPFSKQTPLVSEAEKAVISRSRELFGTMGTLEEKDALEDALYALRAFRTAWEHTEGTKAA